MLSSFHALSPLNISLYAFPSLQNTIEQQDTQMSTERAPEQADQPPESKADIKKHILRILVSKGVYGNGDSPSIPAPVPDPAADDSTEVEARDPQADQLNGVSLTALPSQMEIEIESPIQHPTAPNYSDLNPKKRKRAGIIYP